MICVVGGKSENSRNLSLEVSWKGKRNELKGDLILIISSLQEWFNLESRIEDSISVTGIIWEKYFHKVNSEKKILWKWSVLKQLRMIWEESGCHEEIEMNRRVHSINFKYLNLAV